MAKQLFGTDGIRGVAGQYPLDPKTVFAFGVVLGEWATRRGSRPEVVVGMDTRESGEWLARYVAGGLSSVGARPHLAGVVPTPGIAFLARTGAFVAGVMISASHNPYHDNGLKVFDHSGFKLPDDEEHRLEQNILRLCDDHLVPRETEVAAETELDATYLQHLAAQAPDLSALTIAVDCGHGAAYQLAPKLYKKLGATVHPVSCSPNGRNINLECGALYTECVRQQVLATGADLGVAFDGDADRAMFISGSGKLINGDCVLLICGQALQRKGKLSGSGGKPIVVATIMSNLGLQKALEATGIEMLRTPVGDKYVLEEMLRRDAVLGGEQSGHVIFREYATTGDGILTALRVMEAIRETGQNLDELTAGMKEFPQRLVNIRVKEKKPLETLPAVLKEIQAAEKAFGDSGRVVVRFSGTEPLARVMIEGVDEGQVIDYTDRIANAIRAELCGD